jgi:acetaldehyde dehydrogenase (acetylating)
MSIHSKNEDVILQFGLKKPAFRICVNTPTTHGSIGLTTGLDPAMTLGCGGWGGNITSDNISPRHLLNIKRLAYEIRPAVATATHSQLESGRPVDDSAPQDPGSAGRALPRMPARPMQAGIPAQTLAGRIDQFLASRGYRPSEGTRETEDRSPKASASGPTAPIDFVCEEDVRIALRSGEKLVIGDRTIVTPAARELGEERKVFLHADWPN